MWNIDRVKISQWTCVLRWMNLTSIESRAFMMWCKDAQCTTIDEMELSAVNKEATLLKMAWNVCVLLCSVVVVIAFSIVIVFLRNDVYQTLLSAVLHTYVYVVGWLILNLDSMACSVGQWEGQCRGVVSVHGVLLF